MKSGYTKAWRKEINSDIWKMPHLYHRVFFWLRQKAQWQITGFPTKHNLVIWLIPGQLITSLDLIASGVATKEYGILRVPNKKTIKNILKWLEGNGMIQTISNAYGTTININNWHTYQHEVIEEVTDENEGNKPDAYRNAYRNAYRDADTFKELKKKIKELKEEISIKKGNPKFTKPTIPEIKKYCEERKNDVNPEKLFNHYEATNWIRGKTPIKNWKACVRTWEKEKMPWEEK